MTMQNQIDEAMFTENQEVWIKLPAEWVGDDFAWYKGVVVKTTAKRIKVAYEIGGIKYERFNAPHNVCHIDEEPISTKAAQVASNNRASLRLTKVSRHIWETEYEGEYIDFYRLPSDGLWRSGYFGENTVFGSMDIARIAVEVELTKKARWIAEQGAA